MDPPYRQRDRTSSLSIARSPSILSATAFTPASESENESSSSFPFLLPPSGAGSTSLGLTRTTSHPPSHRITRHKSALHDIPSDEDLSVEERHGKSVSFRNETQIREYEASVEDEEGLDEDEGRSGSLGYTGDFQKPDSKEMLAIILSIAGVGVLALAAGMTTVFDWVL